MSKKSNLSKIISRFKEQERTEILMNPNLEGCIADGPIDEEAYDAANIKVCWILKEAYDDSVDGRPAGGGWGYTAEVIEAWYEKDLVARNSTLSRVGAITFSLNNGYCDTEDLTDDEIIEGLKQTYWINLNKTPAFSTTNRNFPHRTKNWASIVELQVQDAHPDIIIFGNTWDDIEEYPYITIEESTKEYLCEDESYVAVNISTTEEGIIEVNAYHPGMKSIEYETHMINSIQDYLDNEIEN